MTGYGKEQRAQERRDRKRFEAELDTPERWERDPSMAVIESQETDYVSEDRLMAQRIVRYERNNLIVEFAVTVKERDASGVWRELLCIDTCHHGTVHRHLDGDHSAGARQDLLTITQQEDIQHGFWEAVGEAYDLAYQGEEE